jgi:hypothetical protein
MKTAIDLAREIGFHSANILWIYSGNENALCDSELDELRKIEQLVKAIRAEEREAACDIVDWELDSNGHAEAIKIAIRARK